MEIFRDLFAVKLTHPTVLTIGTFDGLHLGHQYLIKQVTDSAANRQARSAVIAFHPRPKTVLAPHLPNNDYLTTPEERIDLFRVLAIDALILIPFTLAFAQTTADDFMKLLVDRLNLVELWAGHDFALGKNREGNIQKLTVLGRDLGYSVQEFEPLLIDGEIISSTRIRQLITAGDVRRAACLLGRYPALRSTVVRGAQRGHTLGFPTANLSVSPERLLPTNGVYATFATLHRNHKRYPGVTNIGIRPSFGGDARTVETHIFDFEQNIYDETVTLEFVEHLRPEKKFNGIDELVAQITKDATQARSLLGDEAPQPETGNDQKGDT